MLPRSLRRLLHRAPPAPHQPHRPPHRPLGTFQGQGHGQEREHGQGHGPAVAQQGVAALLRSARIRQVAFIRHGNTAPAARDFERQLTPAGEAQASASGRRFGAALRPFAATVLCSPAPRCRETARLFLEAASGGTGREGDEEAVKLVPSLYDGTMQPEGSDLFERIGYEPLRAYLEHDELRPMALAALGPYADDALHAILDAAHTTAATVGEYGESGGSEEGARDATLLLCAHAVYLPSAALHLAEALGAEVGGGSLDSLLDTNTGEGEGYLVTIGDDDGKGCSVTVLSREGG